MKGRNECAAKKIVQLSGKTGDSLQSQPTIHFDLNKQRCSLIFLPQSRKNSEEGELSISPLLQ
jgi:hypothetical protein